MGIEEDFVWAPFRCIMLPLLEIFRNKEASFL